MTDKDAMIEAVAPVLKGVGKIYGDGWKDTTRLGEIVFVWGEELPPPYEAGQYPRVGNEVWAASVNQYDFSPASVDEVRSLFSQQMQAREQAARDEGRKQAHQDRPSDGYRVGSAYGRADEQSAIVAWLRSDTLDVRQFYNPGRLADAIERNEHREQKDG